MIRTKSISGLNCDCEEGKLLISAMAILTSIEHRHITSSKFGPLSNPDEVLQYIVELANKIYYEEEWKEEQIIKNRDIKIESIIKEKPQN